MEINEKKNFKGKWKINGYKKLDTSITRLCNKFKLLKSDWCKLHSRIKRGSGLVPSNEPLRFKHIDPVFSESNAEIRLSSSAHETSFVQEDGESDDNDSNEEDSRENKFKLMNRLRQLTMKMWITQMTNTKTFPKGLKMNLTWAQLIRELPRKNAKLLSLLTKNQSKSDQTNRMQVKLPVD